MPERLLEDGVARCIRKGGIFALAVVLHCMGAKVYGLAESTGPGGSNAQAVHALGEIGQDVNVGFIAARNVRVTHEAFLDGNGVPRVFAYDFSGDGIEVTAHDTALTGIIASRGGTAYPNDVGAARGCRVYNARVADNNDVVFSNVLTEALEHLIMSDNCRVIVTGFELSSVNGDGESFWTLLYDYYAYTYGVVFANAAGNQSSVVTVFGDGYNGITTGGLIFGDAVDQWTYDRVGTSSGTGPSYDGRRKPDVTGPSQNQTVPYSGGDTSWTTVSGSIGQTSYSAPHTAGVAALLLGAADATASSNDNESEVVRAVIVNSTFPNVDDKEGYGTNPADANNTWHGDRGYGRLDALRAYMTLDSNELVPGGYTTEERGWAFGTLAQGQQDVYTVSVPFRCRIIATIAWDRRVEWVDEKTDSPPKSNGVIEPGELHPYLADLDMVVRGPDGPSVVFSEELFGLDPNNNLEKCDIELAGYGDYTITIVNDSTNEETADYGFGFELRPLIVGDFAPADYIVDYWDVATVAEGWLTSAPEVDDILVPDGVIDFRDFARFAEHWLEYDPAYYQRP